MIQRMVRGVLAVSRMMNVYFKICFFFFFLVTCLRVCVCVCRRVAHLDLTCSYTTSHVPFSSASLLPVCTSSQVWKLADTWPRELIILDPRPITPHYPLCGPLSGERHVTIARHESRRHRRALMDAPARPRLLRSPGQQTFKFSNSRHTKEALVQGQRPWPLEVKHRGGTEHQNAEDSY